MDLVQKKKCKAQESWILTVTVASSRQVLVLLGEFLAFDLLLASGISSSSLLSEVGGILGPGSWSGPLFLPLFLPLFCDMDFVQNK
jgi:hypothetical protein